MVEFKTIKNDYRQEFDKIVNEHLKNGWTMIGKPKALQESYKESERVYKQIVFVAFLKKDD